MDKDFINREMLISEIKDVYTEEAKKWNASLEGLADEEYLEEICEEESLLVGNKRADDFNKYFLSEDYHMDGNFANLKVNWEFDVERGRIPEKFCVKYNDVYKGLIDGSLGDEFEKFFKDWAVSWFFYAFGTWGLSYNFGYELDAIFSDEIQEYFDRKEAEKNGVEYDPTCKQLELAL